MRKPGMFVWIAAILGTASFGGAAEMLTGQRIVPIPRDFTGNPVPKFQNGLVLALEVDRPRVLAFDRNGKTRLDTVLEIPGAVQIRAHDLAAAPDGTIAVAAGANDAGRLVGVICWMNAGGGIARVVRIANFGVARVAFAPDGHLWAAGRAYDERFDSLPEYDMLREYDSQGVLVRIALPVTKFSIRSFASMSYLMASRDRIGFFSAEAGRYAEVSPTGELLGSWPLEAPAGFRVTGAALTGSNDLFLSVNPIKPDRSDPHSQIRLHRFERSSGALLEGPALSVLGPTNPVLLMGADADQLVFYSKPPAAASWYSVQ